MVCLFVCFQQVIPLPLLLSGNFTPTILNSPPPTMAKLSPGEQILSVLSMAIAMQSVAGAQYVFERVWHDWIVQCALKAKVEGTSRRRNSAT